MNQSITEKKFNLNKLNTPDFYLNRHISLLQFNIRVLEQIVEVGFHQDQ